MNEETPIEKIIRRSKEVQEETIQLADELVRVLKETPAHPLWEENILGIVERWESAETVAAALKLCIAMVLQQNPFTERNLTRQLRRWRRAQQKEDVGWLEVRSIRGHQYVYYRWRESGERKIRTQYFGRADGLLVELALLKPAIEERERKRDEDAGR